jgi:hypothetical protein
MDAIPIWFLFAITVALVLLAAEGGYRLGDKVHQREEDEKESPVSAMAGAILGLLAFILAFTFAIVSDRYDARKELVREEANALRTAYSRAEFLPEADRVEATAMLQEYVADRLALAAMDDLDQLGDAMRQADAIQRQLWATAVANARKDMNSDVAALYLESLNEVTNLHWLRVAIGVQARIPSAIWMVLLALIVFGMLGVGYQTAITGSKRTWAVLILAVSFSLVIALIAELDRPQSDIIAVTQQPLEDLQVWMAEGAAAP